MLPQLSANPQHLCQASVVINGWRFFTYGTLWSLMVLSKSLLAFEFCLDLGGLFQNTVMMLNSSE
jgi:hypothetical protein